MRTLRFLFISLIACLSLAACSQAPNAHLATGTLADTTAPSPISGDSLALELSASEVTWVGTKVTGQHTGSITLSSGYFRVVGDSIVGGTFVFDMKSITDHDLSGGMKKKLEEHLRSADFFDVPNHPTATFTLSRTELATPGDSATHWVTGQLTLRGVTKQLRFPATIRLTGTADHRLEALAKFNFNRKDFGVAYVGSRDNLIRDEINLSLNLVSAARHLKAAKH